MALYPGLPQSYVAFMKECAGAWGDLCEKIEKGDVPTGTQCKVEITVPGQVVDQVRFEILAASAEVPNG